MTIDTYRRQQTLADTITVAEGRELVAEMRQHARELASTSWQRGRLCGDMDKSPEDKEKYETARLADEAHRLELDQATDRVERLMGDLIHQRTRNRPNEDLLAKAHLLLATYDAGATDPERGEAVMAKVLREFVHVAQR